MMTERKILAIPSPSNEGYMRINHACATETVAHEPKQVLNAFSRWACYDKWAPAVQGAAHYLVLKENGPGSRFILYDKPGKRHLAHYGVVTAFEPSRCFGWQAPFSEWPRAIVGSTLEVTPTSEGGSLLRETFFFEAQAEHLGILEGFLTTSGYDSLTFERFLQSRLYGFNRLLVEKEFTEEELSPLFSANQVVARDWAGRVAEGEENWVRILYADGELDFDGPPDVVFNAFTRFSRYADWTRDIHVGCEWLDLKSGGVGSKFLLWEKPGQRQVMHYAAVTEMERNRKFTWRAPFAEWGKVFIGTSMTVVPRSDGGTHVYHILYADMPEEYLPVFGGFGSLHGFDLEFETFHIYEEARGFNALLREGAFSTAERSFIFDRDESVASDWPMPDGRPWPHETVTLKPQQVMTYEEVVLHISKTLADMAPSPAFVRQFRNLRRTRHFNLSSEGSHGQS